MIKGIMIYTIEDMQEYCKNIRSSKGIFWFYRVLTLIYIIGIVIFAVIGTPAYSLITMCSVLVIIALLYVFMIKTVKKTAEIELEKLNKKYNKKPVYFEFDYNKITIDTKDGIDSVHDAIDYDKLEYVIETDDYFYFAEATNNNKDFIFKKSSITDGSVKDLEDIFRNALHDKFKVK